MPNLLKNSSFFISLTVYSRPALLSISSFISPSDILSVGLGFVTKFLVTTLIHRVLGHPRGLGLFILLTKIFLISLPSALHTCSNYSSRFILIKKSMSDLLYNLFIISLLLLSNACISELKIGPYMVHNVFLFFCCCF